jgi:hypothetical protein
VNAKNPQENPFNGAPLVPGNPGNRGGKKGRSGRPSNVIREACAKAFDQRIKILKRIADGEAIQRVRVGDNEAEMVVSADVPDRIKAIDLLGKYAGLQKIEHEHSRKPYREAVDEVRKQAGLRLVG